MVVSLNRLLPIRAIGPGICLIGRDRFSLIMEATPVNFSLRSLGDQDRLVHGYTAFLNGLHFPVELLVRSDVLRLDDYLGDLKSREEEIEPALRPSLSDYIDFIQEAVSVHHLLRRRFFVILPWQGSDSRSRPLRRGEVLWQEAEQELFRRRDIITQGMRPLGIRLRMFSSEETFKFFYASLGGGQPLPPGVNWAWD